MNAPPNLSQVFIFKKYNWSNNGQLSDNNPDSDKTVAKYIYGDNINNIDNKISAKTWQIYISTRKSDYIPNISIYLDQNQNRLYNQKYIFAKIQNMKDYLSQIAKVNVVEFSYQEDSESYTTNISSIISHIRSRETDNPVVIISDWLGLDDDMAKSLDSIYSLTDLFCFEIPLPNISSSHSSFYLSSSPALYAQIYDL